MPASSDRIFKTAWFAKASKKAHITDHELYSAVRQVMLGQADDLGGGVFKKRLGKNLYRSLILARGRQYWVYAYLFAKKVEPTSMRTSSSASGLWLVCTPGRQPRIWPGKCNSKNWWRYADENQTQVQE